MHCRESEPDWPDEIGNDVKEECSKFGTVLHTHVDRNSQVTFSHYWPLACRACWLAYCPVCMQGFVYLKFGSQAMAQAAQKALHGRWFAGRQVVAEFQIEGLYRNYFKA